MKIIILIIITMLALAVFRFYFSLKKKYDSQNEVKVENKPKAVKITSLKEEVPVIESEKILLRPLDLTDTKPLSVLMSNPKAVTPVGLPAIKKVSQLKPLLEEFMDTIGTYAIVLKSSERLIGLIEIDPVNDKEVDVKFFLGKQFWGHGFGKAVLSLVETHLRGEDYQKIRAQITLNSENKAFLEKEGFTLENGFYILNLK